MGPAPGADSGWNVQRFDRGVSGVLEATRLPRPDRQRVPAAEPVFFPLDEELGLLPGTLAPRQQEHLVHLASCMPFKQAARMLGTLMGVRISEETTRRLTERMGAHMEAAETAEADPALPHESTGKPAPERCVLSVDVTMISLVHQQWVEVRTLAIGQPYEQNGADGEREVHVDQLTYFSRLADASTFTERHRPDALRILDFPHAAGHVSKLLEALQEAGLSVPAQMLQRCLHLLKHPGFLQEKDPEVPAQEAVKLLLWPFHHSAAEGGRVANRSVMELHTDDRSGDGIWSITGSQRLKRAPAGGCGLRCRGRLVAASQQIGRAARG